MSGPPSHRDPFALRIRDVPAAARAMREALRRSSFMQNPRLTYLFWECTRRCNLKCTHCGSACDENPLSRELGTFAVLDVLQTIIEDFDTDGMVLAITGGEPLLRTDLEEVTQVASSAGMVVGMVSNATLAKASRVKDLVQCGMTVTSVSVDGPRELHDAVRGLGNFDRTMAGIEELRTGGIKLLEIITCVRPANLGALPELEAIVRKAGARAWRLITIDRMGRAADPKVVEETWLDGPQLKELMKFIRSARQRGRSSRLEVGFSCGGYLGPQHEFMVRPRDRQCYAGICVGSILSDGLVSACPSLPRSMAQGSVLERRFSDVWNTEFKQFRETEWRKTGQCARCTWFGICMGGGLHERLVQPDEFCWLQRLE